MSLELAPERERPAERRCKICGEERPDRICTTCGVDLETGELVAPPSAPESEPRDGSRPERRAALARELEENAPRPETTREVLTRALIDSSYGLPGTIGCLVLVLAALALRIPGTRAELAWPNNLGATFVLSILLLEQTRAAREGRGGLWASSGTLDPSQLGRSLLLSFLVVPLLAGPFAGDPTVAAAVAFPLVFLFPLFMGALSCDGLAELGPGRLFDALRHSPLYVRTALLASTAQAAAMAAVWLADGSFAWRAPVAVFGTAIAGSLAGLMRRDAETTPET